jgi:hypothetical protein
MGPLDLLNHLLNFFAPAVTVGLLLALVAPLFYRRRPAAPAWHVQAAINSVAGAIALMAGLWFFGHDGNLASYAAMLLACTVCQGLGLQR